MKWKFQVYWNLTDLEHKIGAGINKLVPATYNGNFKNSDLEENPYANDSGIRKNCDFGVYF